MNNFTLKSIKGMFLQKLMVTLSLLMVFAFAANAQSWTVYDGSALPADAEFSAGSSNTTNGTELLEVLDDADNAGNKLLSIISGSEDKFYWESPSFSEEFTAGGAFTVIMRAKGISADYDKVTEIELKDGVVREKLRIQTNNIINFEKSDKLDVPFPEGISALDFCIYRIVFEGGKASVWINETYMGEGLVSTTTKDATGWVFGDSNSSSSYGALIDWIIWDETGAYAPTEGAAIPSDLVQTELPEVEPETSWTVYDGSALPADADFSAGSSNTANGTELLEVLDDADNAGNKLLSIISGSEDKFYWESPSFSEEFTAGGAFTVIMRAKGISADYDKVTEIELKNGVVREKLRIQTNNIINFEKSDKLDVPFPEGISALDFCIYRIVFEGGKASVWINETYMGEGLVSTTTKEATGWVFGDSNGSSSYGALIDWIIWDETGAFAPGEGEAIPSDLVQTEIPEPETSWSVYEASVLPADAEFSAGSSNTANGTELIEVLDDVDNAGNKLLSMISGSEDKFYWSAPSFSEEFTAGAGFTVMMRAKGISADYDKVTEIELKNGVVREKLRIQTNNIINFEKSDKLDVSFPEGISALDFCIYRIVFEGGKAKVWINETFMGEGLVSTTTSEDMRWVFGDSNSSSSYGALIDWIIWDETGAYAPGQGETIPESLVQTELEGIVVVEDTTSLSVSVETISFSEEGGEENVTISSNVIWTASTTADWLTIDPATGENDGAISIVASANTSTSTREATIVITDGANQNSTITVTQEAEEVVVEYDEVKLTIVGAVASAEDGANVATNVFDGDFTTRWAGDGDGAYITVELDAKHTVSFLKMSFNKGDERNSMFDILTSVDGETFVEASMDITSDVSTDQLLVFDFDDINAKFVKIIGHGNSSSSWNSYWEIEVWGFEDVISSNSLNSLMSVQVYPNPASDYITINSSTMEYIELYKIDGSKVMQTLSNRIDVSGLNSGLYFIKVYTKDGIVKSKFLKQ